MTVQWQVTAPTEKRPSEILLSEGLKLGMLTPIGMTGAQQSR
jgi:hypothetical protein